VHPRQSESQFLYDIFCWAGEIWWVGVVHVVVLACVLKATTKKRSSTLLKKKVHPRENTGYAYDRDVWELLSYTSSKWLEILFRWIEAEYWQPYPRSDERVVRLVNSTSLLLFPQKKREHTHKKADKKANSAFHPSGVGKWVPASAGKAKAGMVHSVSRWTRGVQVKLWDPLRTHAIPECLRGVLTTRRYTNSRLPLPYLYLTLRWYVNQFSGWPLFLESHGKSWNLVRPFSKPGKSWKTAKVMESHGKGWWCPGIFCKIAVEFLFL